MVYKKLSKFKLKDLKVSCSRCGISIKKGTQASVNFSTWNPFRRYKPSGYPWVAQYRFKLCPKCFKKVEGKLETILD